MPIPEEEMLRRCREVFGDPLDADRRDRLASLLDTLARANLQTVNVLEIGSEPMGHAAVLKSGRHGG